MVLDLDKLIHSHDHLSVYHYQVGSSLSGSKVTAISHGFAGVINPVTVSGMIVAAGATGHPVVSSTYPEWIAQYMLEQNNGYYPLPVSISNVLAYLFPATAQAYWDEVLEHAFAANQARLGSAKGGDWLGARRSRASSWH